MSEALKPGQEYEDWKAEVKMPGGELKGKPIPGNDGNWYNQYGERMQAIQDETGKSVESIEEKLGPLSEESKKLIEKNTPKKPGAPVSDSRLWQPKMTNEGGKSREAGIQTPDGDYYKFSNNESFVQRGDANNRQPFIRLANGQEISFDSWKNGVQTENSQINAGASDNAPEKAKLMDRDEEYANKFWERKRAVAGELRSTMADVIKQAAESKTYPFIGSLVNSKGPDEEDKQKLSAYRKLAQEMGYEVGQFKFHLNSHTADAEIRKPSQPVQS